MALAFPDFGPLPEYVSYSISGYGQAWMYFRMIAGLEDAKILHYLALVCTLIGGTSILLFGRMQNLKTIGAWLFLVITLLVFPLKSELFFYPLNVSTIFNSNYSALSDFRRCVIANSIIGNRSGCGETSNGSGASEYTVNGFSPQLAVTHVMGILHRAVYAGLYTQDTNGPRVRDFIQDMTSVGSVANLGDARITNPTAGYEVSLYRNLCGSPADLLVEPFPAEGIQAQNFSVANTGRVPYTTNPVMKGVYMDKERLFSLTGQIFTFGKIIDANHMFYTNQGMREQAGFIPPFAVDYDDEERLAAALRYAVRDENVVTAYMSAYKEWTDDAGVETGVDLSFLESLANVAYGIFNQSSERDSIGFLIAAAESAGTGLGGRPLYKPESSSRAYMHRAAPSYKTKDSFSEVQLKLQEDPRARNYPVMLALMRPQMTAVFNPEASVLNGVLGVENGYALQTCADFQRVTRKYALYDVLSNLGYSDAFIKKIIADTKPAYDNSLISGTPTDSQIKLDDFYFTAYNMAESELLSAQAVNRQLAGLTNATPDTAMLHEKARAVFLDTVLRQAFLNSPSIRTSLLAGSGATTGFDASIAAANKDLVNSGFGDTMGAIAGFVGKVMVVGGSFFVGARAVVYLEFLKILVAMVEMFALTITPLVLLVGLAAPAMAGQLIMMSIAVIVAIKAIPITFTIVNGLMHVMNQLILGQEAFGDFSVQQSLLVWAAASVYTGIIGITLMLLPKAISSHAGFLNKIEKAAEDIANTSVATTEKLAIAAGAAAATAGIGMASAGSFGAMKGKALQALAAKDGKDFNSLSADERKGYDEQFKAMSLTEQRDAAGWNTMGAGARVGAVMKNIATDGATRAVGVEQMKEIFTSSGSSLPVIGDLMRELHPTGTWHEGNAQRRAIEEAGSHSSYKQLKSAIRRSKADSKELGVLKDGWQQQASEREAGFHAEALISEQSSDIAAGKKRRDANDYVNTAASVDPDMLRGRVISSSVFRQGSTGALRDEVRGANLSGQQDKAEAVFAAADVAIKEANYKVDTAKLEGDFEAYATGNDDVMADYNARMKEASLQTEAAAMEKMLRQTPVLMQQQETLVEDYTKLQGDFAGMTRADARAKFEDMRNELFINHGLENYKAEAQRNAELQTKRVVMEKYLVDDLHRLATGGEAKVFKHLASENTYFNKQADGSVVFNEDRFSRMANRNAMQGTEIEAYAAATKQFVAADNTNRYADGRVAISDHYTKTMFEDVGTAAGDVRNVAEAVRRMGDVDMSNMAKAKSVDYELGVRGKAARSFRMADAGVQQAQRISTAQNELNAVGKAVGDANTIIQNAQIHEVALGERFVTRGDFNQFTVNKKQAEERAKIHAKQSGAVDSKNVNGIKSRDIYNVDFAADGPVEDFHGEMIKMLMAKGVSGDQAIGRTNIAIDGLKNALNVLGNDAVDVGALNGRMFAVSRQMDPATGGTLFSTAFNVGNAIEGLKRVNTPSAKQAMADLQMFREFTTAEARKDNSPWYIDQETGVVMHMTRSEYEGRFRREINQVKQRNGGQLPPDPVHDVQAVLKEASFRQFRKQATDAATDVNDDNGNA